MNNAIVKFLGIAAAGGLFGAVLGWIGTCSTGSCPLTANPWRGALFGVVIGGLIGLTFVFQGPNRPRREAAAGAPGVAAARDTGEKQVVDEAGFRTAVLESKGLVLVDFYADWCGPCRKLAPVLAELAAEQAGAFALVKVNVDHAQALARKYDVQGIPHLLLFRDGTVVGARTGYQSKAELLAWMQPLFPAATETPPPPPAAETEPEAGGSV